MYMGILMCIGILSAGTAGVLAQVPTPSALSEIGKWPVTIALIALAGLSVYLMYRQAENSRKTSDKMSDSLLQLTSELKQRPCIRDPHND